jgi:dipeptidyl aminopeptidase/acylaminoacyl peptidase
MEASYATGLAAMERAIDDLARSGDVDPRRVGIGGLSFGSTVVIWSLRHAQAFAAATISSGQVTPHYYWSNALPDRGFSAMFGEFWGAGDPEQDSERWRIISPAFDAASIDTPLLMQVPESEVRNLAEFHTKLKRAGKPAEMIAFAGEIHVKYQPVHKRAVYERNLDWYRFWLKGEEDRDPAKAGQYARWRKLRAGQSLPAPAP